MQKLFSNLLIIFISFSFVHAQEDVSVNFKSLDSYFEKMVNDWDVPGVSIGIVKDGKLVFVGNYGTIEIGKEIKPTSETLYAIASNSKAFTSAIIGMLVQEGKLAWDDTVRKYLPYFKVYDDWVSEHTTIRDILSHRVGLGTFSGDNIWYKSTMSAEEIIKKVQYVPQAFDFRSGYGYSNLMYITAGEIIRVITGKSWEENVRERILTPLEMNRTIVSLNDLNTKGNYATPHSRNNNVNEKIPWVDWENVAATGGLISCVEDIAKWMIFNLNNGIHKGDTILTSQTRNMVWTPHNNFIVNHTESNDFNRHFNSYGLGWGLSDYHGNLRVSHTGGYDGFITAINLIPDKKLGVVVLTNGLKSPIMAASYFAIDRFLGLEEKDWSKDLLERTNQAIEKDTRISDRKMNRVLGTKPSISVDKILGAYHSKLVGNIHISKERDELLLSFDNAPLLTARLTHWHYNVWQLHWTTPQAWFSFGTVQVTTNNENEIEGLQFDVPNNDIFFHELHPKKIH